MIQKDKDLLLQDLCARLPYGVKISIDDDIPILLNQISYSDGYVGGNNECYSLKCFVIKPYLFPLSNMTEEQKEEFTIVQSQRYTGLYPYPSQCSKVLNWLHKNHFDYKGLIEKGLAIDATGLNIY